MAVRDTVLRELNENDGILAMKPAWVYRTFLPSGRRMGLKPEEYTAEPGRGEICERWLVSETQADNEQYVEHEGRSYLNLKDSKENILLTEALAACPAEILGEDYAGRHRGLDRLLKIFDYKKRLFYHIHQTDRDAKKLGRQSKEEAYYYLDGDPGTHPETFFGVHPWIVRNNLQKSLFLPYLKRWEGEEILKYAWAYINVPGEGFHLPAGLLHAPGTAMTLELQESSDVMAVFQAEIEGTKISKAMLFKDVPGDEIEAKQEEAALDQIDWEGSADPYFYENHHLSPKPVGESLPEGVAEEWVWYNSRRFSGSRVTIQPKASYVSKALGVHGIFVRSGKGFIDSFAVEGGKVTLTGADDEYLVAHKKALKGVTIRNTGEIPLVLFKFFGPEINDSIVPFIKPYRG
jgi:hypothetical protein